MTSEHCPIAYLHSNTEADRPYYNEVFTKEDYHSVHPLQFNRFNWELTNSYNPTDDRYWSIENHNEFTSRYSRFIPIELLLMSES